MKEDDIEETERTQHGVQSLENGLSLMMVLAHNRRPMKLTVVAERAGISPGKAHRYLVSFIRSGFVSQDEETGLYGMGPAALEFSLSCLATIEPIAVATREAQALCAATGHTVAICVWGSFGPTVVRWEQTDRPVLVNAGLGTVYPLYRTATGRVFAAFMQPSLIREHAAKTGQIEKQEAGIETIEQVQRRGIARSIGELIPGTCAFAAPVYDDRGRLVLSLTILGYRGSFDARWSSPLARAVRESAEKVSGMLGYKGPSAGALPGD